jgi:hypothetical protein
MNGKESLRTRNSKLDMKNFTQPYALVVETTTKSNKNKKR